MSDGFFENLLGNLGLVGGGAGGLVGGAALGGAAGAGGGTLVAPGFGTIGGGGYGAWVGGAAGATAGAAGGYLGGKAAGEWIDQTGPGQYANEKIQDFKDWIAGDQAADNADAKATAITCATCAQNPCAALACGVRGSKFRGGAHGCMTGTPETKGDVLDSHHMPARSISPLHPDVGPAIQMDPRDHRMTNSYGRSPLSNATLAGQQEMIASGNFIAAQAIDVGEVMAKFPGKYDAAIYQMEAYTACLKRYGII